MVAPEANAISPAVMAVIKEARNQGVTVVAVTGRSSAMARELLQANDFRDPCIFEGGAQLVDPVAGKVLWSKQLPPEVVRKVVGILKQSASIIRYDTDALHPADIDTAAITKPSLSIWASVMAADSGRVVGELQAIPRIAVHANAAPGGDDSRVGIQVTHVEADKEYAIRELLSTLRIDKAHTLAIGDGDNDKPLLRHAAVKVAMGNASEGLKQIADYIVEGIAEDGFASALRQFVLKR